MKTPLIAAAVALLAAAPQLASAQAAAPRSGSLLAERQVKVAYSDLDLQNPRDARVMLHRIRLAAIDACGSPEGANSHDVDRFYDCHRESVARAVAQLDARLVTAAYLARPDRTASLSHWLR